MTQNKEESWKEKFDSVTAEQVSVFTEYEKYKAVSTYKKSLVEKIEQKYPGHLIMKDEIINIIQADEDIIN